MHASHGECQGILHFISNLLTTLAFLSLNFWQALHLFNAAVQAQKREAWFLAMYVISCKTERRKKNEKQNVMFEEGAVLLEGKKKGKLSYHLEAGTVDRHA